MRKIAYVFATLSMVWGLAGAAPSYALTPNSYVSATGSGTICSFTTPCGWFQYAVDATYAGGVVHCLDAGASAGNSFSITKSIVIDCAGLSVSTSYITINGAGIVVTLRHLRIEGVGFTFNGIDFQNGAALFVEDCVIEGWNGGSPGNGIHFAPTSGTAKLFVTDSVIKNNGKAGTVSGGIFIQPAAGAEADVTIERTKIENNRIGINANSGGGGTIHGVVRDSVVSGNTASGIIAVNAGTRLLIENATVTGNNAGLVATASANMLASQSSVVLNRIGLVTASGGTLSSYKNNNVNNNNTDGAFTTAVAQK